ncbi:MAG TPA: hypothetical protein VK783_05130 [Bacteroidia bacterium]|jgi:hypothetical protein|nr:hypothetical protein [Bacteroidia bacterium]
MGIREGSAGTSPFGISFKVFTDWQPRAYAFKSFNRSVFGAFRKLNLTPFGRYIDNNPKAKHTDMEAIDKEKSESHKALPNDFPGHEYGDSQVIKVFTEDLNRGACAIRRCETSVGTFVLTLHTSKKQLFTLEGPLCMLIGTGNVLSVDWYIRYLQTFPDEVRHMMHDLFEEYRLTDNGANMFAINNTFRILPAGEGFVNIYFPDNSSFMVSNNIYDVLPTNVLIKNDNYWGFKISHWIRSKLSILNKKHGKV